MSIVHLQDKTLTWSVTLGRLKLCNMTTHTERLVSDPDPGVKIHVRILAQKDEYKAASFLVNTLQ